MMKTRQKLASLLFMGAAFVGGAAVLIPVEAFAQEDEENRPRRRSETLDPATAKALGPAYEALQAENYTEALRLVDQLLAQRGDRMKAFDKSTTYEIRGSINAGRENFRAALSDFQTALNSGGLPPERNNQLRYFIAQLHFQLEQFQQAINGLNQWIRSAQQTGQSVSPDAYYLLGAAYVQIQPPNYRAAMPNAESVVRLREKPKKSDFDLLNLIYSELSENNKRAALLERMINIWPGDRTYWAQLAGLYSNIGRDQEAFSVLEVSYRAGLTTKENEILTLVQFYSFFDNPYRGAKLLEREMEAGRVKRTQKNLVLLSQLLSQSREHKRAIPVLREAAGASPSGELSYRLGQVLLADEQYGASSRALTTALNKGGMKQNQTGDAWLLLGTARFSQAAPEDCAGRLRARAAFVNATRYSNTGRQARDWVTYIDAINQTIFDQDKLENAQNIEATQASIERLKTQKQVCRLQGESEGDCATVDDRISKAQSDLVELQRPGRIVKCGARPVSEEEAQQQEASAQEEASDDAPADGADEG